MKLSLTAAAGAEDVNPDEAHALTAQTFYQSQFAQCHGRSGEGDGPEAPQLRVHLRSFADCGWMSMMSDGTIFLVIKDGATAAGFPAGMPAFGGKLGYDQMVELVKYVRAFCAGKKRTSRMFLKKLGELSPPLARLRRRARVGRIDSGLILIDARHRSVHSEGSNQNRCALPGTLGEIGMKPLPHIYSAQLAGGPDGYAMVEAV